VIAAHHQLDPYTKSLHTVAIMNSIIGLTAKALRKAADLQERILSLQEELGQLLGGEAATPAQPTQAPKKKWKFSAASRAKMRAAQKARWAKIRGTTASASPEHQPKGKMSAAGRAAISAAAKARWAKARKAGKSRL
jgi:hypothetical protein